VQRIDTHDDVAAGIAYLIRCDARLAGIYAITGPPPLRRTDPGLKALLFMITEQMISLKAAAAIWQRFEAVAAPFEPRHLAEMSETDYRSCGLSGPKLNTMRALASAVIDRTVDLDALDRLDDTTAIAHLTAVKGIGEWTAQVYLLACHGRTDIWPARDVALQAAAHAAFDLPERPHPHRMEELAADWRPMRAVAARLLWAYYRRVKGLPAV
jgi:DNA-3-methyladenine glycosylase II